MGKKLYLFLVLVLCMTSAIAQNQVVTSRTKADKEKLEKNVSNVKEALKHNRAVNSQYRTDGNSIISTTILSEDFSNFTAGSEAEPDALRLDDPETSEIDDTYFNTPGWVGLEVYQAGGCALLKFSNEYGETGMLITPLINTSGNVTIKCRMKSVNPEGDYVGYNIADEDLEILDSNIGVLSNDQWTEMTWFTTYGAENTYFYIFSYEYEVYVDDIEIVNHYMPTPTYLDETNITDTSFTANWEAIEGADDYNFFLYSEHTAKTDETYYLYDFDFNDIVSEGTDEFPEEPEEGYVYYEGWYFYLHMFFNGGIGLSGLYSEYWDYAYIDSPEIDLSSDNGKVTISTKLKGAAGEVVDLILFSTPNGYYEEVDIETFSLLDDGWNEYTFELEGGNEQSIIEIMYYGTTNLLIDDFKVSQNMKAGETKSLLIKDDLTSEPNYNVVIGEKYRNEKTYYKLYAIKYVLSYDPYYDDYFVAGGIVSDFTEPRYSPINNDGNDDENEDETGIEDFKHTSAHAFFNSGQLNVFNPNNEAVSVYNINGVCLYSSHSNGSIPSDWAKGLYLVKIGDKVIKAVNN